MIYHWRSYPEVDLPDFFETQADAETWLSEHYLDLSLAGALEVSLYDGDRLIYQMSLSE
ncbi:MAG: hypothetical protein LBR20_08915 [Propionibacteriaceae bacterium]|jgi:hypothetical protein|nr:hypothetical protein [Propionibacteriaceae bacterium]